MNAALWRWSKWHLLGACLMGIAGVLATWATWADIYHLASNDEEYSHIFLVPVIALCLIWVRRARLRFCRPTLRIAGPLMVLAAWGISLFGFYHNIQSLWHLGAVLIVLGCIVSVTGLAVLGKFFPAVLVLAFLVPVPGTIRQDIALPLQAWTATISQHLLQTFGVDAATSGNLLTVNGIPVAIAEACNGLRMVFALILVTFAFCFSLPLKNSVRAFILLMSPLAAILCNVIRILPTAWMYGYYSKPVADAFHDYAGWAMLPIAFLLLYGLIGLLKWAMIPVTRFTLAQQ
ncbi:MAG TPA: exosortase/archaeosortase family protein [Tepidisphaeraceae bacterium]|jgi:exosortase